MQSIDKDQIALGVRQPWAELLIKGIKTIEVRSRPTRVQGPIYLYTSKIVATETFAKDAVSQHEVDLAKTVQGKLIGSIEISNCRLCTAKDAEASCVPWDIMKGKYAWEMANPVRFTKPIDVLFLPYGVWFYPFKRRNQDGN